jgi:tetratricopeptide (TPR) repeat protein
MVSDLPLLIVATYRDDERPHLSQTLPGMRLMKLERLTPTNIADLSISMLGAAGAHPHIVNFLHQETEGNAYFVVEVVRALAEETGHIDNVTRFSLPSQIKIGGIRSMMQRRLSRVPPDSLPLLRLAAVAGRELQLEILEQVRGDLDLDEWLTICANRAILEMREGNWRFSHDKLRETTLEMITLEARPLLHRQIAEAMGVVFGNNPDQAITLAQHWRSAGDALKERIYAQRAGEHALSVSAFADAVSQFERTLELVPMTMPLDADLRLLRASLRLRLGEALKYMGEYDKAQIHLEEALKLRREIGNLVDIAEALLEIGDLFVYLNNYVRVEQVCEEGLSIYRELNDISGISWALERLSLNKIHQGDYPGAARLCEEALALARSISESKRIASAINNLGMAAFAQGDYSAAATYFNESLAITRLNGERRRSAACLINLGSAAGEQHDYEEANRCFEEALAIFRSIGERRTVAMALDNLGVIAERQGNYKRASYYFEESLMLYHTIGDRVGVASVLSNLGNNARTQGQIERASDLYYQALHHAQEMGSARSMLEILAELANLNLNDLQTLEWLGLILNHPATYESSRNAARDVLDKVRQNLTSEEVETHLEWGKSLDLKTVVAEILSKAPPDAQKN